MTVVKLIRYNVPRYSPYGDDIGVWLRPVERTVRVREVESSNLSTPTKHESRLPTRGSLFYLSIQAFPDASRGLVILSVSLQTNRE